MNSEQNNQRRWYEYSPPVELVAVCDRRNVRQALDRVLKNRGAPGVDGVQTSDPRLRSEEFLRKTVESVRHGTYAPALIRSVEIPKPNGGTRTLGIPTVRDRVVLQACAIALGPVLESLSSTSSFAYRRKRGPIDAVRAVQKHVRDGYRYLADLDIVACFDHLPHALIVDGLKPIVDADLLELIQLFLRAGVETESGGAAKDAVGIPQGSPFSPLLCNLVLTRLDRALEKRGIRFIRYADDIKLMLKSKAAAKRAAYGTADLLRRECELEMHPLVREVDTSGKSRVVHSSEADVLGFTIASDGTLGISRKRIPLFMQRTAERFWNGTEHPNLGSRIRYINRAVQGWLEYYRPAKIVERTALELDMSLLDVITSAHPKGFVMASGRTPDKAAPFSTVMGNGKHALDTLQALGIRGFTETLSSWREADRYDGKTRPSVPLVP